MENLTLFAFIWPFIPVVLVGIFIAGINAKRILDETPTNTNTQRVWLGYLFILLPATLVFVFSTKTASADFKSELLLHFLYVYGATVALGFPIIFILKELN
jgi:hypothetical protein